MQIGAMKYTIAILAKTTKKDDYGAEKTVWYVKYTIKAGIKYKSGTKNTTDMEQFNVQSIEVNIRYRPEIDETMRISFDGKIFKINFINELVYRSVLQLNIERIPDSE